MITAHTHHVSIRPTRQPHAARITIEPGTAHAPITTTEHHKAIDTAIAISRIAGKLAIIDHRNPATTTTQKEK